MNTCQTSIKDRCMIIVLLLKTSSWYYRQYENTTVSSPTELTKRWKRRADKQLSSNMYRRSTTETIRYPIGQNIPVIIHIFSKLQSFREFV